MNTRFFLNNLSLSYLNFVHRYIITTDKYPIRNKGRFHNGLLYTIEGTETYIFKNTVISTEPGSVLYIPKGESYQITLSGEKSVVIAVDFELFGQLTEPFLINFSEINAIRKCFFDMEDRWEKHANAYLLECKALFYKSVTILSKQAFSASTAFSSDLMEKAVQYLQANYLKHDFRIEDISSVTGISRRYFEILFKSEYQTTPKSYILSLKIEKAKELLLSEKIMIKDVAYMLGYGDIYHFSKLFKLKTGYTPSEYRQRKKAL